MFQVISNLTTQINVLPLIIAVCSLEIFYYVFKVKWPDLYFAPNDQASYYISLSKKRFFSFRLAPVFISVFVVIGIFYKNGFLYPSIIDGIIIGILHGLRTHGFAFWKIINNSKSIYHYFNKPSQLALHAFSFLIVVIVSTLAAWSAIVSPFQIILPDVQGLVDNIWSALITLFLGAFVISVYQNVKSHVDHVFEDSINKIGGELMNFIKTESNKYDARFGLVLAVCVIENIQRPAWFRKLEILKSYFYKTGSYGIMQVKSDQRLTDKQSVSNAIDLHFRNTEAIATDEDITEKIKGYNKNPQYIDQVKDAYYYILNKELQETNS